MTVTTTSKAETSPFTVARSLVIPVYKNEANIPELLTAVERLHGHLCGDMELVFVVDGSPDRSWEMLHDMLQAAPFASQLIELSRNFGAFSAVRVGMQKARGKYIAVMAADLQEPPELIGEFYRILEAGEADVVFGQRSGRDDSWLSKVLSNAFWGIYRRLVLPDIPKGGVDVFGCTASVRDGLLQIKESRSSLIAQLFWIGFKRVFVPYRRRERTKGRSSWSFRKRFYYMLDSIFSWTDLPIMGILWIGMFFLGFSVLLSASTLTLNLMGLINVRGYTALMLVMLMFFSFSIVTQGVLGCYLWRVLENSKRRPAVLVRRNDSFEGTARPYQQSDGELTSLGVAFNSEMNTPVAEIPERRVAAIAEVAADKGLECQSNPAASATYFASARSMASSFLRRHLPRNPLCCKDSPDRPAPGSPGGEDASKEFVPTGHFYSAVPSLEERERFLSSALQADSVLGIEANVQGQIELLERFKGYYAECPFPRSKVEEFRYYFENPAYSYGDALILYSMIRHFKPRRIVEIGSGFSSCVTLDTIERFLPDGVNCTFIEPYPDLVNSLIQDNDKQNLIIAKRLQDVDTSVFRTLESNDILFIDSTHVSKLNSDVNKIFFDILPSLQRGVLVHFHDIFWPFEYPKEWIREGRAWNEAYMLRAFLQHNDAFEVVFFSSLMHACHQEWFQEHMPLYLKNPGGNIWLRRVS